LRGEMHRQTLPHLRACHHILALSRSKNDACPTRHNHIVNK
jgi:hypothetical protein